MPCQVFFRDRFVDISHGCLEHVIASAATLCQIAPQSDYIHRCVAQWQEKVASSGHNLLGLDLDRLVTDSEEAGELRAFLAALRRWVDEHSRGSYPDGRATTWVDRIAVLFAEDHAEA